MLFRLRNVNDLKIPILLEAHCSLSRALVTEFRKIESNILSYDLNRSIDDTKIDVEGGHCHVLVYKPHKRWATPLEVNMKTFRLSLRQVDLCYISLSLLVCIGAFKESRNKQEASTNTSEPSYPIVRAKAFNSLRI